MISRPGNLKAHMLCGILPKNLVLYVGKHAFQTIFRNTGLAARGSLSPQPLHYEPCRTGQILESWQAVCSGESQPHSRACQSTHHGGNDSLYGCFSGRYHKGPPLCKYYYHLVGFLICSFSQALVSPDGLQKSLHSLVTSGW